MDALHGPNRESQRGFTLLELLIGLAMTVLLVIGVLEIFDLNNRVTRAQMQITEMQQSMRFAQHDLVRIVRMAGRGGLPGGTPAAGLAVAVRNNVGVGTPILVGGAAGTPEVLPDTDVLTVRGVFDAPIYQINLTNSGYALFAADGSDTTSNPRLAVSGTIQVCALTTAGVIQDLQPLTALVTGAGGGNILNEALILQSPLDTGVYGVVEMAPEISTLAAATCPPNPLGGTDGVTVAFRASADPGSRAGQYRGLSPAVPGEILPAALTSVAFVGLLEEYRFYVRQEWERPGDQTSDLAPRLSRARVYPGTETAYPGTGELAVDVADNILDLQVALGYDSANLGSFADDLNDSADPARHVDSGQDDEVAETADGTGDDWLYNAPGEDPATAPWNAVPPPRLQYIRLTTLARTDRRDPNYQAPLLERLEDRAFAVAHPLNQRQDRLFRRRTLSTVVDMRNVS
jgi:type II secretory pathway pseudopilin PulG